MVGGGAGLWWWLCVVVHEKEMKRGIEQAERMREGEEAEVERERLG